MALMLSIDATTASQEDARCKSAHGNNSVVKNRAAAQIRDATYWENGPLGTWGFGAAITEGSGGGCGSRFGQSENHHLRSRVLKRGVVAVHIRFQLHEALSKCFSLLAISPRLCEAPSAIRNQRRGIYEKYRPRVCGAAKHK
jgi:hypothetical protein